MTPKQDHRKQLSEVTFKCRRHNTFKAVPEYIDPAPDDEVHPFHYRASCPICEEVCGQAPYERALLKAWQSATGPKTDEGKAAAAANLEGHPTKDESLRTRFNAMKHGVNAKVATYFPSKPDGYALCSTCEVDRGWCAAQPACVKQTQNFMMHQAAFQQKKPGLLMDMYSEIQASIYSILQQIIITIVADGVKVQRPVFHFDERGKLSLGTYVNEHGETATLMDVSAHPLLKPLSDFLTKNNMSLADMGMTNKVIEAEDMMPGQIARSAVPTITDDDYKRQQLQALRDLRDKVSRSNKLTSEDPILLEHNQENGVGDYIDVVAVEK